MRMHAGFGRRSSLALAFMVASSFCASAAFAAGVTPNDATPVQREEAQTRFAHARELYTAKKFDEAHDEFEKSYAIVASPNALLFAARCDRERGKLVAAYAEYGRTAAEAKEHASDDPRYAKTAEAASAERDEIGPHLGFVTIAVARGNPETTVTVGGERFSRAEWGAAVPVMPGTSDVVITTPGKSDTHQALTILAGDHKTLSLDAGPDVVAASPPLTPPPTGAAPAPVDDGSASHGSMRTAAYVSGAIGGVGLVTFAVAGLMSTSTYNDLTTKCHGPCPASFASEISKGKTQQTIADVGLVVGVVGVAAGVTLFALSIPTRSDRVSLVVGPAWAGVSGGF